MVDNPEAGLVQLKDTDLTLASAKDDVRGSKVVDRNGDEVGDVDGLLIDESERRVRFLQVGSGGFLGIGEKKRLIPVDAVTAVDNRVHLGTSREHVAGSAEYDPDLVQEPDYYGGLYEYYGYAPFWGAGYVRPGYPYL
ncbi:PRC-barrel domain-containing protein [Nocardioides sp. NPDC006273]|uniref:PRC-barrel domain-containing protein n=1 Tax=Nocardioides sp. NPDC006273 TaxID=3155598 RepID=UPI0033B325C9